MSDFYKTADGKVFDSIGSAINHQNILDMQSSTRSPKYKTKDGLIWDNEEDMQIHANYLDTGIYKFKSGDNYEGPMQGKQLHGFGKYTFASGAVFEGMFRFNEMTDGKMIYTNGEEYYGEWKNDKRHGKGEYRWPDGRVKEGKWENGNYVEGSGKVTTVKIIVSGSGKEQAEIFSKKGTSFQIGRNFKAAIEQYNSAISCIGKEDKIKLSEYYENRGFCYSEIGEHDKAIADFNEAIRLTPNNIKLYKYRSAEYIVMGNSEKVISSYKEAISLHPDNPELYEGFSCYFNKIGDKKQAIEIMKKAADLGGKYAVAYLERWGVSYTPKK